MILQMVKRITQGLIHTFHRLFHCNLLKQRAISWDSGVYQPHFPPIVENCELKAVDFSISAEILLTVHARCICHKDALFSDENVCMITIEKLPPSVEYQGKLCYHIK